MSRSPEILFLPVSGATGLGEYARCLTIANGLRARVPDAAIRFVLSREAPYAHETPFPALLVDGSPTLNTEAVNRSMRERPPDLVVFDNAGRSAQAGCAHRLGARTVLIATRPNKRRKAFSRRWLSCLDQVWVVQPAFLGGRQTFVERLRLSRFPETRVLYFGAIFPDSIEERRNALLARLGLDRPYVAFMAGGGGWQRNGVPTSEIFADAAAQVAERDDVAVVAVMGPLYRRPIPQRPGVIVVPSVDNEHAGDLLHDARLVVLGGGSIVVRALALDKVAVVAPVGGRDQPRRVRELARLGVVVAEKPDPAALAAAARRLLDDPARFGALQARVRDYGLENGLSRGLDALVELLERPQIARG